MTLHQRKHKRQLLNYQTQLQQVGVVFIVALFNDTVVKILAQDTGCETPLSLLDS